MAGFRFSLDAVLQHRQRLEDERQRDLARHLRQQLVLETQVRSLQQTIADDKRDMAASLTGRVEVGRVRSHGAHVNRVSMRVQQIVGEMVALKRRIEKARQELAQAMRDRKAMQVLHDREHRRWTDRRNRREAAEMDELGMQSYARRQRERVA